MAKGVTEGYTCKMQIITSHFPATLEIKGEEILIKNLYGQKYPLRTTKQGDVNIRLKGDEVILTGLDKHDVSNTAGKIQELCVLRGKRAKDPTTFHDGVYVVEKTH